MIGTCNSCLWWLPNRAEFRLTNYAMCLHPRINFMTLAALGCANHVGKNALEVNVPQHVARGTIMTNATPVDGPTEILIVTHAKDLPWLKYCLRSIQKFCRGFQGVVVAVPNHQLSDFLAMLVMLKGGTKAVPVRFQGYDEVPGKGMLQHMAVMAQADLIVPPGTRYVLTCDADCIFQMPTTPEDYFANGKPYYIVRSWASLTTEDPAHPGSKVVSDCLQWKPATDRQVGFDTQWFTMCMNTVVFPLDFFARYRAHIEQVHGRPFQEFMLDGRNEFPQSNMDFTAMGAYAHRFMPERFTWFDVAHPPYPADRKRAYWSHGGITPEIRNEIEEVLK